MKKSFVQDEAICSHKVVCFDLRGNIEICLGTPLCWLDTFSLSKGVGLVVGLREALGTYWQNLGGQWGQNGLHYRVHLVP